MPKDKSPECFFTDDQLSPVEQAFIQAVEEARNYAPTPEELAADSSIRGGLIRAILLGMRLKHHPSACGGKGRRVRMTAHGIRIVPGDSAQQGTAAAAAVGPRLRITQTVDLRGVGAAGGGSLPPLEFCRCSFDEPIELSGAHLQSLTLRGCRFRRLSAKDARINGSVLLGSCRPLSDPVDRDERYFASRDLIAVKGGPARLVPIDPAPLTDPDPRCDCPLCSSPVGGDAESCRLCCVIDFTSAEIAGSLDIEHCYLRAPRLVGRAYRTPRIRDETAVRLNGLHVHDSLRLVRCTVLGHISLISAEVDDDVWIQGGKFIASAERRTLNFQLAMIGGVLVFQGREIDPEQESRSPVMVVGQISGLSLDVGEVWIGEGFFYGQDPQRRGAYATINFAKANIKRTFKIGAYHDHYVLDSDRRNSIAHVHGEICVVAADIGKNFEVHGAFYEGLDQVIELDNGLFKYFGVDREERPYLKLRGHGVKVDRRVYISHGHFRDADRRPVPAPVSAAAAAPRVCQKTTQPAAIDLWKSTIGTGFRIGEHCRCTGAIRLNSCVIGREAIFACKSIEPAPAECAGADGERIPCVIDIAESTIRGQLKFGRRDPRAAPGHRHSGPVEEEVIIRGGISAESTNVQGSILLAHLTFDLAGFALPPPGPNAKRTSEGKRVALNLRDCVCGSDLDVHGLRWKLPALSNAQLRRCRGPWGPGGLLSPKKCRFGPIREGSFAEIDLRGFRCGLLVDGFGAEWGLIYRLRLQLAGIKIGEVEPRSHKAPHACSDLPEQARLRWLAFQNTIQPVADQRVTDPGKRPVAPGNWERLHCSREDDFVPQAYDALSCVYRKAGEDWASEQILLEKKNMQNTLRFRRLFIQWWNNIWTPLPLLLLLALVGLWVAADSIGLVAGNEAAGFRSAIVILSVGLLVLLWPLHVALFQFLFRFWFRYGLSANSALTCFLVCILAGATSVHIARNGGVESVTDWEAKASGVDGSLDHDIALVLDVEYEPVRAAEREVGEPGEAGKSDARSAGTREEGRAVYARASPCNLNVSSLLYALDVFLPLIDLDQERRCSVRDALPDSDHDRYFWWRFFKVLYELLGWVVTSLVILTITGVLRRDLER